MYCPFHSSCHTTQRWHWGRGSLSVLVTLTIAPRAVVCTQMIEAWFTSQSVEAVRVGAVVVDHIEGVTLVEVDVVVVEGVVDELFKSKSELSVRSVR